MGLFLLRPFWDAKFHRNLPLFKNKNEVHGLIGQCLRFITLMGDKRKQKSYWFENF